MQTHRVRLFALVQPVVVAFALMVASLAAARADVVTRDPVLPPEVGAYVGTNGGAGCFVFFGVCANAGSFGHFVPVSSTFDAAGQQLLFDATFTTTVTTLGGTPVGTITFTGDFGETVFGRTGPDETGSWNTEITSLDLDGTLTGPLAGVTGGIGLDSSHTSTGRTSITPVKGGFRIDSFFDVFVELTLNTTPPVTVDRGPQIISLVPEPGSLALLLLPLSGLLELRRRARH